MDTVYHYARNSQIFSEKQIWLGYIWILQPIEIDWRKSSYAWFHFLFWLFIDFVCQNDPNCSMGVTKTFFPRYLCLFKFTPKLSFYHTICFKCDLCRICNGFFKLVKWMHHSPPIKSTKTITYHGDLFRHHIHHNARNFDSSFSKSYIVQCDHFMFNWLLDWTSVVLHV